LFSVTLAQGKLVMKYDTEYNSYKFSSEELINLVDGLTFYSRYSPLDKITKESVKTLVDNIIKSTKIPIAQ